MKITKIYNNKKIKFEVRDSNCKKAKCFLPFSGNGNYICRLYELGKCPHE